jgi:hypothetical protein
MFGFLNDALDTAGGAVRELLAPPTTRTEPTYANEPPPERNRLAEAIGGAMDEGLDALLEDPVGVMDRQDAKADLAPYFAITPEDFVGPRNHNQVTPEEYDEVAKTYSDIRLGRGDLKVHSESLADSDERAVYNERAMTDIGMIMTTSSGREQIMALNDNPDDYQTTILPRFTSKTSRRMDDVSTDAKQEGYDPPSSLVYYKPADEGGEGRRTDRVLVHELQHAYHDMNGTTATGVFDGGPDHFDSGGDRQGYRHAENKERQAVGLTNTDPDHPTDDSGCPENTYAAERNQLGDHFVPREHYNGPFPGVEENAATLKKLWSAFIDSPDDTGLE